MPTITIITPEPIDASWLATSADRRCRHWVPGAEELDAADLELYGEHNPLVGLCQFKDGHPGDWHYYTSNGPDSPFTTPTWWRVPLCTKETESA